MNPGDDRQVRARDTITPYWVAGAFGVAAIYFAFLSGPIEVPLPGPPEVDELAARSLAPRTPLTDPPTIRLGGFERDCMDCHIIFRNRVPKHRELVQHLDVLARYQHGRNDRCLDCHDREDRNRLTLGWERTIPFAQSAELCGKCHGLTHRDWERGTHGKTVGSWQPESTEHRRLTCVECHDPHRPAYPPFIPLAGPNTLRMGEKPVAEHASESPLLRHRTNHLEDAHPPDDAPSAEGQPSDHDEEAH